MNKKIIYIVTMALLQAVHSTSAGAASPLPAKDVCFILPEELLENNLFDIVLIRPQKPLNKDISKPVPVVGLESIVSDPDDPDDLSPPPLFEDTYFVQLAGSASFIPSNISQSKTEGPMISLVGTSTATRDGTPDGVPGVWSMNYSLFVDNGVGQGKFPANGRLRGTKTFQPLINGSKPSDAETLIVDAAVTQIKCR